MTKTIGYLLQIPLYTVMAYLFYIIIKIAMGFSFMENLKVIVEFGVVVLIVFMYLKGIKIVKGDKHA